MKKKFHWLVLVMLFGKVGISDAQTLNWDRMKKDQRLIVSANAGVEYAFITGLGIGYQFKSARPVVLNAEFSRPAGRNFFDDYKIKTGGQICWLQHNHIRFSTRTQAVFRRYHTDYATLINIGSDIAVIGAYYRPTWFIGGEAGFDKAIITYFRHSDLFKENYPAIQDGWYEPATGGNIYFGIQTGYSFRKADAWLRAGRIIQQDFKSDPSVPVYALLGVNLHFK